ncbi:alpha/beta hydrolase, partial [candidate division KSB1 bacterium]|nr:alpha/beta hydrolase [candidate division KSB1 bacterium]
RHPDHVAGLILLGASTGMWTDDGSSRQDEFMSQEENYRIKAIRQELIELLKAKTLPREEFTKLLIYNNFLNGDWKRQHFYKPSLERMAQIARYEWVNDNDFNSIMNQSADQIDLTGAFKDNPIPTLILEGKWDLTWAEKKKQILQANHPSAKMVLFENAAHGIYDEEPEKFFAVLEEFSTTLPEIDAKALAAYQAQLIDWERSFKTRPEYKIRQVSWGLFSSKKLAAEYQREWLANLTEYSDYLRIGFALYDLEQYSEALYVFEQMEQAVSSDSRFRALALIWQGHMLDLSGKRYQAIARYKKVADMNLNDLWKHDQYGLRYKLSPYAKERMVMPFQRVENRDIE